MNRHIIRLLVLAVGLMIVLPATVSSEVKVSAGIKGGLNLTMPAGDDLAFKLDEEDLDFLEWIAFDFDTTGLSGVDLNSLEIKKLSSMTSFLVGGFLNIQLSEIFSIQPEFLYVRKGGTQDVELGTEVLGLIPVDLGGTLTWKLDYFEIPLLAKLTIATDGAIAPSFFAGPALGFAISSNLEVEAFDMTESVDIGDFVASMDFSFVLGASVDIDLSPTSFIVFDGRYSLGLSDWSDEPLIDIIEVKNGGLQFMAGIGFRFGGE